jgi:hypothetical protein
VVRYLPLLFLPVGLVDAEIKYREPKVSWGMTVGETNLTEDQVTSSRLTVTQPEAACSSRNWI